MPDMPNSKEFDVGQDKAEQEVTDVYDKRYGKYAPDLSSKPTQSKGKLPNEPKAFAVKS